MEDRPLSRAEIVSGSLNRSRRAAKLLTAVEARCIYMRDESRRVVAAYLLEGDDKFEHRFDGDYIQSLKLSATSRDVLLLDHLERFAPQWKPLIPSDPDLRARLIRLIQDKYGLTPAAAPRTLAALDAGEHTVQAAYKTLYGRGVEEPGEPVQTLRGRETAKTASDRDRVLEDIEARLEWQSLTSGEILYRAGDAGDALYVLISGRVRVLAPGEDGVEQLVDEVGRGELLGELEVLTGDPRSATVRAVRDSELVRLGRQELLALAHKHTEVLVRINALIARRLRKHYLEPGSAESAVLTFALLPCSGGVPVSDFGRDLAEAFAEFGPTMYLTPRVVDEAIEPGAAQASPEDARNAQVVSWLSELESRYRHVIYEAEPGVSEWSRRCIRQADRVVLIGRVGEAPRPEAHETGLLASETGQQARSSAARARKAGLERPGRESAGLPDLVLLHHPGPRSADGTTAWLEPRRLRAHHHVRFGDRGDMASLARRLTGNAFGLVLGGGGARGFAHVGVYRALQEAGIEVDIIGGTSMGALIAGAIGIGMDWREMREMAARLSSPITLFDPTLPVVSLFSSGKVSKILHKVYGETLLEDLWRPIFCVSSNLTHASETVHRQGVLWKAVRASMSIPGIFSPVLHDGDLQVDGAVMNNVPTDVMHDLGQVGRVVTVNVMPPVDLDKQYRLGSSLSGTRALFSLVNPYDDTSAPLIYESLVRVMALHDVRQEKAKQRLADIYITPPVEEYNILDFASFDPIIDIGYRSARQALAAYEETTGKPVQSFKSGSKCEGNLEEL
ncbi:MAG: patatin-like phospholipase family protein, partial [Rudaea sp.]